ncbi:MAG: DUF3378 domain-containing protein [Candidatus Diapherotrites archaeon]
MQSVLNFPKAENEKVKAFLSSFGCLPVTSPHMECRAKINDCAVTLYSNGKIVLQGKGVEEAKEKLLQALNSAPELVLGFDETGRGEAFGPMVISAVLGDTNRLRELRDSKKTNKIAEKHAIASKNSLAQASVSLNAEMIDSLRANGLNLNEIEAKAIDKLIELFAELGVKAVVKVDGSALKLKNKVEFIVKGDDLEPVIGAASVEAKFLRDNSADAAKRKSWNLKK